MNDLFLILKRLLLVNDIFVTIVRLLLMNPTVSTLLKALLSRNLLSFIIPVSENDSVTLSTMRKILKFISEVFYLTVLPSTFRFLLYTMDGL